MGLSRLPSGLLDLLLARGLRIILAEGRVPTGLDIESKKLYLNRLTRKQKAQSNYYTSVELPDRKPSVTEKIRENEISYSAE